MSDAEALSSLIVAYLEDTTAPAHGQPDGEQEPAGVTPKSGETEHVVRAAARQAEGVA